MHLIGNKCTLFSNSVETRFCFAKQTVGLLPKLALLVSDKILCTLDVRETNTTPFTNLVLANKTRVKKCMYFHPNKVIVMRLPTVGFSAKHVTLTFLPQFFFVSHDEPGFISPNTVLFCAHIYHHTTHRHNPPPPFFFLNPLGGFSLHNQGAPILIWASHAFFQFFPLPLPPTSHLPPPTLHLTPYTYVSHLGSLFPPFYLERRPDPPKISVWQAAGCLDISYFPFVEGNGVVSAATLRAQWGVVHQVRQTDQNEMKRKTCPQSSRQAAKGRS